MKCALLFGILLVAILGSEARIVHWHDPPRGFPLNRDSTLEQLKRKLYEAMSGAKFSLKEHLPSSRQTQREVGKNLDTDNDCDTTIYPALVRDCPEGLRDDGTSCWLDSVGRGAGRIPDKTPCGADERDDGTSCWLDTYGRGAGRPVDKTPCPSGLRDDGTSCWSDAHIYGKGCCCTIFGCCSNCASGYHDDGCTCRKTDVGIKLTLFQRQGCHDDEDLDGALCYPKCKAGYHTVGCCMCEPDGGPRIVATLDQRQRCNSGEEMYGALCYPKCETGYDAVGCCICEPEGGPGIKITLPDRQYCTGTRILFSGACVDIEHCTSDQLAQMEESAPMTSVKKKEFQGLFE